MSKPYDKTLRWLRRLAVVPRWVVVPMIKHQSVAEHTFHVTCTARWLVSVCAESTGKHYTDGQMLGLLNKCLDHDIDEAANGDAPSPSKGPKDYSDWSEIDVFVKVCDLLEAYARLVDEKMLGNSGLREIGIDTVKRLEAVWVHFRFCGEEIDGGLEPVLKRYIVELNKCHPGLEGD